jgi:hypothetical protein
MIFADFGPGSIIAIVMVFGGPFLFVFFGREGFWGFFEILRIQHHHYDQRGRNLRTRLLGYGSCLSCLSSSFSLRFFQGRGRRFVRAPARTIMSTWIGLPGTPASSQLLL